MRVFRGGEASPCVKRRGESRREVLEVVARRRKRGAQGRRAGVSHTDWQLMALDARRVVWDR